MIEDGVLELGAGGGDVFQAIWNVLQKEYILNITAFPILEE